MDPVAITYFGSPVPAGWIYPCSVEDIKTQLSLVPAEDLRGIAAVGLVPATRKDCSADARYFFGEKAVIEIYSFPATLRFKLKAHFQLGDVWRAHADALSYGMEVEAVGSRVVCVWTAANLRAFFLEHVLMHEVGHHVYYRMRQSQGLRYTPRTLANEQFAEDYANRFARRMLRSNA